MAATTPFVKRVMTINSRKLQAAATKEKIWEKAVELFSSKQFEEVTVDLICEECGVAKGTFYHHFESKEGLAADILHERIESSVSHIWSQVGTVDTLTLLQEVIICGLVDLFDYSVEWAKVFLRALLSRPSTHEYGQSRSYTSLLRIFETGLDSGEISAQYSASYCVDFYLSLTYGLLLSHCMKNGAHNINQIVIEYTAMAYKMLAAD